MSQENKNPSSIPPEREAEYLKNAESAIRDATDPVIEKLAAVLLDDAEITREVGALSLDPVGEAERATKEAVPLDELKAPDDLRELDPDTDNTASLRRLLEKSAPTSDDYRALTRPDLSKVGFANIGSVQAESYVPNHLTRAQHKALSELDKE